MLLKALLGLYCEIYKQRKYTAASQNFTPACRSVRNWNSEEKFYLLSS